MIRCRRMSRSYALGVATLLCALMVAVTGPVQSAGASAAPSAAVSSAAVSSQVASSGFGGAASPASPASAVAWGGNGLGQLGTGIGNGATHPEAVLRAPGSALPATADVTAVAAGPDHACAVAGRKVYCWGSNTYGQLGTGTIDVQPVRVPVQVVSGPAFTNDNVTAVAVGNFHTCVLASGIPYCWGDNTDAELGTVPAAGGTVSAVPLAVTWPASLPTGTAFTAITAGQVHSCALAAGQVFCWGSNSDGQTGQSGGVTSMPSPVAGFVDPVTAVDAGAAFTCAIAATVPYCWGSDAVGQLGNGPLVGSGRTPGQVDLTGILKGHAVQSISAGQAHACVVADGLAACWGEDDTGQLGDAVGEADQQTPVAVSAAGALAGTVVTAISAGGKHTCAIANQLPFCWGLNTSGQLGNDGLPGDEQRDVPSAVVFGSGQRITALASAGSFTVAIAAAQVPGSFVPLPARRLLDTRIGVGASATAVPAGGTVTLRVVGLAGVPQAGVAAVALNVTAMAGLQGGHVIVYPDGGLQPNTSNINFSAGQVIPNLVVVKVGGSGAIRLFNGSTAPIHLLADLAGYYLTSSAAPPDGSFVPLDPTRLLDTRVGNGAVGPVAGLGSVNVQVTGRGGVPTSGVSAVVLNLTVADATAVGHIVAYPTGTTQPAVSNLNFAPRNIGQPTSPRAGAIAPVANLATVPIGTNGQITLLNGSGRPIQLIADVAGYYWGGTPTETGTFVPVAPSRLLDTRTGGTAGVLTGTVVGVFGVGGVPSAGVSVVVLNVTVTDATAGGHITVYPEGVALPAVSSLNFRAGQTIANLVVTAVTPSGIVTLANGSPGAVNLIVDVQGYFLA